MIRATSSDELLTAGKAAGMLLGLIGVAVLFRPDLAGRINASLTGMAACLGAALSYGCANALGKYFHRLGIVPVAGAAGQMTATAIMALPLMLTLDTPWRLATPSATIWAAMAGLAVLSTALGYVIFFRILASAGATNISLVTLLIPVSAVLLGGLILGERVSVAQGLGMILIAAGLIAIDGRASALAIRLAARRKA